jgi:hypothetical protein
MKAIPLSQGKFAIVDDEFYDSLSQFKWSAARNQRTYYAQRSIYMGGKSKTILMHRVVAELAGLQLDRLIDHCNNNGLDNRKDNLRSASRLNNGNNLLDSSG